LGFDAAFLLTPDNQILRPLALTVPRRSGSMNFGVS
jgi:hypothetical protein